VPGSKASEILPELAGSLKAVCCNVRASDVIVGLVASNHADNTRSGVEDGLHRTIRNRSVRR